MKHENIILAILLCIGLTACTNNGKSQNQNLHKQADESGETIQQEASQETGKTDQLSQQDQTEEASRNDSILSYQSYSNASFDFSFLYRDSLQKVEYDGSDDTLLYFAYHRDEKKTGYPKLTPNCSILIRNISSIEDEIAQNPVLYWGSSQVYELTIDNQSAAFFVHDPGGSGKYYDYSLLIEQDTNVISISFYNTTGVSKLRDDFLDIAASLRFTTESELTEPDPIVRAELSEIL